MKYFFLLSCFLFSVIGMKGQVWNCTTSFPYGTDETNGHYAKVNGINMYYETYGDSAKQPLLLIHGSGGSVRSGACQIEYFKDDYYVIVADSRFHGRTDNGTVELNYRLMASDYNALLNHLQVDSVNIIGQSDGGIIGLHLAIEYPSKVNKLVAAAPNLRPDATAIYQWNIDGMKADLKKVEEQIAAGDSSNNLFRIKTRMQTMLKYPNIDIEELHKIKAPVFVVFGDSDYMPLEHVIEIYQNIPNANLWIVPSAGHRAYRLEPDLFNMFSKRFFDNPFKKPSAKDGF